MRALITSDVYRKVAPKDLPAHEYNPKNWEPPWKLFAQLDFVEDGIKDEFSMCANQFNRKYTFQDYSELAECKIRVSTWEEAGGLFDFGYALTVHKAQGSQFNEVLLIVDGPGRMGFDEYKRWLYTAITRAVDRITILI
jgi:superfamily I DNA/RNA helicase